ncbi:MAG: S9 family peptidase [Deltaproteobacteria bacterium]|nr:S9 family peptidase [Deltaproteobacteria bacterium]
MPKKRAPEARPLTFSDIMAVERISQPAVSPDGRRVAFVASKHDPKANKVRHTIRLLDIVTRKVRALTPGPGNHTAPAWSPDGGTLAFVSNREKESGAQLWLLPMDGGEARRLTSGYGGVGTPVWSPDGKRIAFSRRVAVAPMFDEKKHKDKNKEPERAAVYGLVNEKSSARVEDALLFRHWDAWRDRRRNHVFAVDVATGQTADLTPGDVDSPPISLGSECDFDWAPDGKTLAVVLNPDEVVARSTNNSIFLIPMRGHKAAGPMTCVSDSEASDCHPRFAKDGRLVYLGMAKPGYEADKIRIKIYDPAGGKTKVYLEKLDRSAQSFEIAYDEDGEESILFLAQDRGRQTVYRLDPASGRVRQLTLDTFNGLIRALPHTDMMLVTRESTTEPADFFILGPGGGVDPFIKSAPAPDTLPKDAGASSLRLTHYGKAVVKAAMTPAEEFWYPGDGGHPVHGFLIRPPDFNPRKKYPMILLIHGGPQSAFMDHFHFRWNAQMFAARGAVVAFVNPRGSTGYGSRFTDQISGDWGGRCYRDIMKGVDHILAAYPFIDDKRVAAAGASFGGFMVNWIMGHTDRFRAIVCHDGVFFAETMAYTTEELWFDEHEHGGLPHVNRKPFIKFSPHMHIANFKTPTLVVHGENDFRCPMSEGLGLFTALQVMGVPSRFLHFPDEGHWVLKPANSEVWYHEVVGWLMKWIEK